MPRNTNLLENEEWILYTFFLIYSFLNLYYSLIIAFLLPKGNEDGRIHKFEEKD